MAMHLQELSALAASLVEQERWDEALGPVAEEHARTRDAYGAEDERTMQALATYAGVMWQLDNGNEAKALLTELIQQRSQLVDRLGGADASARSAAEQQLADAFAPSATSSMSTVAAHTTTTTQEWRAMCVWQVACGGGMRPRLK